MEGYANYKKYFSEADEKSRKIMIHVMSRLDIHSPMKISELQEDSPFSLNQISAMMLKLKELGLVRRTLDKKAAFFSISDDGGVKFADELYKIAQSKTRDKYTSIEDIISKAEKTHTFKDTDFDADKVRNDKKKLIEYIKNIIGHDTAILSLKERYNSLYKARKDLVMPVEVEKFLMEDRLDERRKELQEAKAKYEDKIKNKPVFSLKVKVSKPTAPNKPTFDLKEPVEPDYKKPGIFNKKRVLEENEKLKANFEKEKLHYEEQYSIFLDRKNKYDEALKVYESEMKICEEEERRLNREQYDEDLRKYEVNKKEWLLEINKISTQQDKLNGKKEDSYKELLEKNETYQSFQKLEYEMEYITSLIEKNIEARNRLYSYGIIFGKYRNYIPMISFCDYLQSGRCDCLTGPNGAYNLFEQESRADLIIYKLDQAIDSLEQIKTSQYYLYAELRKMNQELEAIEGQLLVNNVLSMIQINQLDQVVQNTGVAAYYAQQTAQLTKTSLFLKAL